MIVTKSSIFLLCSLVSIVYLLRLSTPMSYKTAFTVDTNEDPQSTVDNICNNVNPSDSFTESETDRANDINQFLSNIRGQNALITFATSGEDPAQFGKDYGLKLIPYASIGIAIFVLSILILCCHCCDYACFKSCSSPSGSNRFACVLLSLIFCVLMVGASVGGWYFSKGLDTSFQRTSCAGAHLIGDFAIGSSGQNWIGLNLAIQNLTQIQDDILNTLGQLPNVDDIHQGLTDDYNQLKSQIQSFYQNNSQVTVPDPINSTEMITPDFIAQLGPPSNTNTISGAIMQEANTKYNTIDSGLESANSSINSIKSQSDTITSTIQEGIDDATDLNSNITDILNQYSSGVDEAKKINGYLGIGVPIFFIVAGAFSIVLLVGVLNSFTLKSIFGLKVMKVTRYLLNVILILCGIVSAVVFPVLIVAMEGCNAADTAFKNETVFNGYVNLVASDFDQSSISTYTHTCFFSDGNILNDFGVYDQINDLNVIFDQIQNLSGYYNLSIPDSFVIPIEQFYVGLFDDGELPVTAMVLYELSGLNNQTNNPQLGIQDTWRLNSVNCSNSDGTLFQPTIGANYNLGNPTCIGFDQFTKFKANQRYSSQVPSQITAAIGGFQNHISSVANVFTTIGNDLDTVNGTNAQFMQQARSVISPLANINQQALNILTIVGNNQTGLASNLNCGFVKTNSQQAVDNLCIAYLPILFMTSVFVLAFAFFTLIGLFPVFFTGKIQNEENNEGGKIDGRRLLDRGIEVRY